MKRLQKLAKKHHEKEEEEEEVLLLLGEEGACGGLEGLEGGGQG